MTDLSILIPARCEEWLSRTIADLLEHCETDFEIIAVLDGAWADPPIPVDPRVTVIHHAVSVGQRAACNEAARAARGKYVMKVDAHCSFAQGFDRIMLEDMQGHDDLTMVPIMKNLHVFDWVCGKCAHRMYQGPTPPTCPRCGGVFMTREIVWRAKDSPNSKAYCFDAEPHFQYFREFNKRPEGKGDLTETMSLQGSCFLMTRERYFALGINDETWGSWGSQGIEVACKTWLSGGRVVCNQRTHYAHMFRTQGGDFGFPYHLPGSQVEHAKRRAREEFFEGRWPGAVRPLSWLVEKFWPVPGWTEADLEKIKPKPRAGIVYYTDGRLDPVIDQAARVCLEKAVNGHAVVRVTPEDVGAEPGILTMFRQILAGLEAIHADYVFLVEHDCLYHPSHFTFIPPRDDVYYYNENVWKVDARTGRAITYTCRQTSGLCASRTLLLDHYRRRVDLVSQHGFSRRMGFEPGTHRRAERVDDFMAEGWRSEYPNIDIRHKSNLTPSRWSPSEFRDQRNCRGWQESEGVPGWGKTLGRFNEFLKEVIA